MSSYSEGGYIPTEKVAVMDGDGLRWVERQNTVEVYRVGNRWAVGKPFYTGRGWIHDYILTKEDIGVWRNG